MTEHEPKTKERIATVIFIITMMLVAMKYQQDHLTHEGKLVPTWTPMPRQPDVIELGGR